MCCLQQPVFEPREVDMNQPEIEGEWLASLPKDLKTRFLASIGHNLTVAGRNSYRPQTEELDKPRQLRRVNEIQHRVLACLHQLLVRDAEISFQRSIAHLVLEQEDDEFRSLMEWAWSDAKLHVLN